MNSGKLKNEPKGANLLDVPIIEPEPFNIS